MSFFAGADTARVSRLYRVVAEPLVFSHTRGYRYGLINDIHPVLPTLVASRRAAHRIPHTQRPIERHPSTSPPTRREHTVSPPTTHSTSSRSPLPPPPPLVSGQRPTPSNASKTSHNENITRLGHPFTPTVRTPVTPNEPTHHLRFFSGEARDGMG